LFGILRVPRSKANLNFVFFILRTFFVLKGGWGTATEKNGTKSVVKFVAGPIRNFGNIAGALNSNIPLGPDFAHGLAAMECACRHGASSSSAERMYRSNKLPPEPKAAHVEYNVR